MAVGSLIRPKRKTEEGLETYECGEPTTGDTWIKFDIRYYTVALVYVVFAVEIAFLFPWAIVLEDAFNNTGVAEGVLFISILFLGLAYVWAKGDLDWVLGYQDRAFDPGEPGPLNPRPRSLEEIEAEITPAEAAEHGDDSGGDPGSDNSEPDNSEPDKEGDAA
ncbi:UNVERIFIED_CONTAM: hypothetical protein GTU68_056079 [Idotea baltica]|nr:hypothetical protein [Idotea baltica]